MKINFRKLYKNLKPSLIFFSILGLVYFLFWFSTAYFGWYGYEKWKYRQSTWGNKKESIERKVFIKDLEYTSNLKLDSFNIFIEKGFKFGYHSASDTRIKVDGNFPYQISHTERTNSNNTVYYFIIIKILILWM
jgi:hypothetical protein